MVDGFFFSSKLKKKKKKKSYMGHTILTKLLPYSSKCALIPNYKGNQILMWRKV